ICDRSIETFFFPTLQTKNILQEKSNILRIGSCLRDFFDSMHTRGRITRPLWTLSLDVTSHFFIPVIDYSLHLPLIAQGGHYMLHYQFILFFIMFLPRNNQDLSIHHIIVVGTRFHILCMLSLLYNACRYASILILFAFTWDVVWEDEDSFGAKDEPATNIDGGGFQVDVNLLD
ncbi:hypothetical protein ACJX0J_009260, partial [Zea mays]